MIADIDRYAEKALGITTKILMDRSGLAVASAVRQVVPAGGRVIILCGCGNNGGDGYAAAIRLMNDYAVVVYDVIGKGQKSESGQYFMAEYKNRGGKVLVGIPPEQILETVDVLVDAIFGTGFRGEAPMGLSTLSRIVNRMDNLKVVSVDVPLGICADDGSVEDYALKCDITVSLSFPKVAMFTYPAKNYLGRVIFDSIGLTEKDFFEKFDFKNHYVDVELAKELLPPRKINSNKGTFGKALLIVGSSDYMGAAALSLEGALRGGAGYVTYLGDDTLCDFLLNKFPEAIYKRLDVFDKKRVAEASEKHQAILIGSGSGNSLELYETVKRLVETKGGRLVIDADAINAVAEYGGASIFKKAKRDIIITPHPLEFSRISGYSVDYIEANRYRVAKEFAKEYKCTVLLKGAATIVSDGDDTYINSSGSSALAKAGSGDVLSGILVSLLAYSESPVKSAALAAFVHGRAGEKLGEEFSSYGVTPSDIPKMAAKILAEIENGGCNGI